MFNIIIYLINKELTNCVDGIEIIKEYYIVY